MRSNYIVKRPHEHTATMCNLPRLPCNLPFSIFFLVCLAGTAKKCWAPQPAWWEEQGQAQSNCIQLPLKSYQVKLGQVSQDSEDAMALWVWGLCLKNVTTSLRPHPAIKDLADFQAASLCGRVTEKAGRIGWRQGNTETLLQHAIRSMVWFRRRTVKSLADKPKCFSGSHARALLFLLMDGLKREQPWRLNDGESLHVVACRCIFYYSLLRMTQRCMPAHNEKPLITFIYTIIYSNVIILAHTFPFSYKMCTRYYHVIIIDNVWLFFVYTYIYA